MKIMKTKSRKIFFHFCKMWHFSQKKKLPIIMKNEYLKSSSKRKAAKKRKKSFRTTPISDCIIKFDLQKSLKGVFRYFQNLKKKFFRENQLFKTKTSNSMRTKNANNEKSNFVRPLFPVSFLNLTLKTVTKFQNAQFW